MLGPRLRQLAPAATVAAIAIAVPGAAHADKSYERCEPVPGTSVVAVAREDCDVARTVAAVVVAAPAADVEATLDRLGWTAVRAKDSEVRDGVHDLVAMRGRAAVAIRRPGPAPDLDGWSAGRELLFSRRTLVGGERPPSDTRSCTSAFLIRFRSNDRFGGLSAAHCAGLTRKKLTNRRNAAMRRPPQPGIALGRVQRMLTRSEPLDALALPVPSGVGRSRLPIVDRGTGRPPWVVVGTAKLIPGREVCFTGRTSGPDRCGRLRGKGAAEAEEFLSEEAGLRVRCTTITARSGDSGGPVYTKPRKNGTTHAIGIVTLVVGPFQKMCFTPLSPVLKEMKARLVTDD